MRVTFDIQLGGANLTLAQIAKCLRTGLVASIAARQFPEDHMPYAKKREIYQKVEANVKVEVVG